MPNHYKRRFTTIQLTHIAALTAILCILGPLTIPLPFSPVPLSFISLALYLMVYIFGRKVSIISYLLYLLIGLSSVPVFSGFSGGFGKAFGPTGGYLLGFIFLIIIMGYFLETFSPKPVYTALGMILGTVICYLFGTIWLSFQLAVNFYTALTLGVLPYLPGDICKMILVILVGPKLKKTLFTAIK